MAIIKKQLLTVAVILLIILVAGCTNNSDEQIKQNNVNVDKDKIVVITKTVIAQYYVGFTEAFLAISVDNLVISLFPEKISLM